MIGRSDRSEEGVQCTREIGDREVVPDHDDCVRRFVSEIVYRRYTKHSLVPTGMLLFKDPAALVTIVEQSMR